jgi:hypothetical protein
VYSECVLSVWRVYTYSVLNLYGISALTVLHPGV